MLSSMSYVCFVMIFYCDVTVENDGRYVARFPDMADMVVYGSSRDDVLRLAGQVLSERLELDLDYTIELPEPRYSGGVPVEVPPRLAFAMNLRKARSMLTQRNVARMAGMSWQQYERLENPHKANPSLDVIFRLQKVLGHSFLAL